MLTVKKLHDDLDYWIHLGIADDIVRMPQHRPEYQHLIPKAKCYTLDAAKIPEFVKVVLAQELAKPWFLQPTFWVLVPINAKHVINRIFNIFKS